MPTGPWKEEEELALNYVALLIHTEQTICNWFSSSPPVARYFVSVDISSSEQKWKILTFQQSRYKARYSELHVYEIFRVTSSQILCIKNVWYCGLQIRYFVQTCQILRTTNSDLIHEQFVICEMKITDLTMIRALRLCNIWPFKVAKICKDRKKIVYVLNFNYCYSVSSGALSRR